MIDPDHVDGQVSLFSVRMQQVEHDGRYEEEEEAAHLGKKRKKKDFRYLLSISK